MDQVNVGVIGRQHERVLGRDCEVRAGGDGELGQRGHSGIPRSGRVGVVARVVDLRPFVGAHDEHVVPTRDVDAV